MSDVRKTNIICDGLILGNADVTDDAQDELRRKLEDQEMRKLFPALFASIPQSE